jgi:hypothetical protein
VGADPLVRLVERALLNMKTNIQVLVPLLATCFFVGCSSLSESTSPKAWAAVQPGMTREQLHSRLGYPAVAENGNETWRSQSWELKVAYDSEGRVKEAVNLYKPK